MEYSIWEWIGLSVVCALACLTAVIWYIGRSGQNIGHGDPPASRSDGVFLFEGERLVSTDIQARQMLDGIESGNDWGRIRACLLDRFPSFPNTPALVKPDGITLIEPAKPNDGFVAAIENLAGAIRIELAPRIAERQRPVAAPFTLNPVENELLLLRDITEKAPCPIWKTDEAGREIWHNAAYGQMCRLAHGKDPDPANPLFPKLSTSMSAPSRQPIKLTGRADMAWYDISSFPRDDALIHYAVDVTPIVMAETSQRNFVQTLSKTFAQLSTGLAIFDRQRQLVLFNPALLDLTSLPADFLSGRPNLLSFFDRLRDARVMPEPKNYTSWREQMTAMVASANEGTYRETWTLPTGSTYQVTGRPHPDGAVAFLFEDISAEISLTRRFRADLELNQSIIDQLPDAIAVFSSTGTLTVTNAAYRKIWQVDPENSLSDTTVLDAMNNWQATAGPNTLWGELRDFIMGRDGRAVWTAPLTIYGKTEYLCTVHPILNGSTLIQMSDVGTLKTPTGSVHLRLAK